VHGSPEPYMVQDAIYYKPRRVRGSRAPYMVHGAMRYAPRPEPCKVQD